MNEQQEFITKQTKVAEAYRAAIARMEKEIETMLDGKPEKYVKENGMPGFHEKNDEIRKIRFEMVQIQHRLMLCEDTIREAVK